MGRKCPARLGQNRNSAIACCERPQCVSSSLRLDGRRACGPFRPVRRLPLRRDARTVRQIVPRSVRRMILVMMMIPRVMMAMAVVVMMVGMMIVASHGDLDWLQ